MVGEAGDGKEAGGLYDGGVLGDTRNRPGISGEGVLITGDGDLKRVGGSVSGSFLFFPGLMTEGATTGTLGVGSGKSTSIPSGVSRGGVSGMESGDSFARGFRFGSEGRRGTSTTVDRSLSTLGGGGISLIGGVDDDFFGFRLGKGGRRGASDIGTYGELAAIDGESTVMTSNDSLLIASDVEQGDFCLRLESAGGTGEVNTSRVNGDIVESSVLTIGDVNDSFANASVGLNGDVEVGILA